MSNKHIGSTLESLFVELGEDRELRLLTLKKVIADRFRERMQAKGITQVALAGSMETSRTATNRLLDPTDTGLTLDTIVRASEALGLEVEVSFRDRENKAPKSGTVRRAGGSRRSTREAKAG
ncbi:MAG TPA: hypothetical protein VGI39_03260 [Polyangiaceae bacterium]|jgi:transcriptional regulator with XRE-family HTH domain